MMIYFFRGIVLIILVSLLAAVSIYGQSNHHTSSYICGVNYIGPKSVSSSLDNISEVEVTHANWISIVPVRILQRTDLKLVDDPYQLRWSESIDGITKSIQAAKSSGYHIMLKPHIILEKAKALEVGEKDIVTDATWRGDLIPNVKEDWKKLEDSYRSYIIELADIAEAYDIELFCIGTELRNFVNYRRSYWTELITEIRSLYKGQLTYSANWDEYDTIDIWKDVDYIGIDAYFPLSGDETPSTKKAIKSWKKIKKKIKNLSESHSRQILFTEYGYRNVSYAGRHPWTHSKMKEPSNYLAQNNLYEAFYQTFWEEEWVLGGFLWNWFENPEETSETDFNVNGKPVINIIKRWYNQKQKS